MVDSKAIYIFSVVLKGQVSVFKNLETKAAQNLAANLTNTSKILKLKNVSLHKNELTQF